MQLPCGAWVEFERHATHRVFPTHTIHIARFWASEADRRAGKPGVRWDATLQWGGPSSDPASRLIRHLDEQAPHALTPPAPGLPHFDVDILGALSDVPDTHGILAHPSMIPLKETLA